MTSGALPEPISGLEITSDSVYGAISRLDSTGGTFPERISEPETVPGRL